tara:strand:- start:2510 stop:3517 length:1008 start_codon:yes stop_codon:yes gene_type:complete
MADKYAGLTNATDTLDVDVLLADANILKVYSKEIIYEAMPVMRFKQFGTTRTDLSGGPGTSINFHQFNNLSFGGATLAEETNIALGSTLTTAAIAISVAEYGKAIGVTEFMLRTSPYDVLGEAAKMLGRHYAQTVDDLIRDTLDPVGVSGGISNYKFAGGGANAAAVGASNTFDTTLVKDMVEVLAGKNVPLIGGDAYICFAHPHQLRSLRDDSAWINASNYGAPTQLFAGEVGRYENVRFIETTQVAYADASNNQWVSGVDTGRTYASGNFNSSHNTYHAIMLGDNTFGYAESVPVEMRDNGVMDFGRQHALAWYSCFGIGMIQGSYGCIGVSA